MPLWQAGSCSMTLSGSGSWQGGKSSEECRPNHPFHIIVAGGIGLKDAEAMAEQLKAKGFAEAKALNSDGKVRVSIRSFGNREEATKQLLELRKNETYKNAWLLAK